MWAGEGANGARKRRAHQRNGCCVTAHAQQSPSNTRAERSRPHLPDINAPLLRGGDLQRAGQHRVGFAQGTATGRCRDSIVSVVANYHHHVPALFKNACTRCRPARASTGQPNRIKRHTNATAVRAAIPSASRCCSKRRGRRLAHTARVPQQHTHARAHTPLKNSPRTEAESTRLRVGSSLNTVLRGATVAKRDGLVDGTLGAKTQHWAATHPWARHGGMQSTACNVQRVGLQRVGLQHVGLQRVGMQRAACRGVAECARKHRGACCALPHSTSANKGTHPRPTPLTST